jgi:hypothetical protein
VSETNDPHLKDDTLAAYLDRALPPGARRAADTHLSDCLACRDELVAMTALLDARRTLRWVRLGAPAVALAAAAMAFMMLGTWRTTGSPGDRMRDSTPASVARERVTVVTPSDGDTVAPERLPFEWRAFGSGGTYLLRLSDESGVRWTIDTADTIVVLPDSVHLDRGRAYHWWVDGLTADGRAVTTGVRRFRTAQ